MKLLDASALIAYYSLRDEHHEKAIRLDIEEAAVNELIFAEVSNVLVRRFPDKKKVPTVMSHIHESTRLETVGALRFSEWLKEFAARFEHLSFADCSLLLQARQHGWILVTFDDKLKEAAQAAGIVVEPA